MDREIKECIVKMRYGMEIGYGQEIVRCKDCNISKLENVPTSTETVRWCQLINRYVDDDWFCADGERKESR